MKKCAKGDDLTTKRKLSETHPHLAEEFDMQRNAPLTPDAVTFGSIKKIHWRCSICSNSWSATPNNRTSNARGCPACAGQAIHSDGRNSMRSTHPHLVEEFDMERNAPFTPDTVMAGTSRRLHWICSGCSHEWIAVGSSRSKGRGCPACSGNVLHSDGRNSMRNTHPHLSTEFDIERNAPLTPDTIKAGTHRKLHWICSECSNNWVAGGNSRTAEHTGCPACSGNEVHSDGRNSMRNTHTHLASEFDMERNAPLTPETVKAGTNKKLHWICKTCSHEWVTSGNHRSGSHKTGCPACVNKVVHKDGRNSMRNTHPHLAAEFDLERNTPLTPESVVTGTNRKLHWNCSECSHEWRASSNSRGGGRGCPVCSGVAIHIDGRNSLSRVAPDLAGEIHSEKNGDWNGENLTRGSDRQIWWICKNLSDNPCGHVWSTRVAHRGVNETGCPACAKYNFNPSLPGQYYVIRILNESGETIMYKGGKSNDYQRRFKEHVRKFRDNPRSKTWTLKVEEVIHHEIGVDTQELETMLLREDFRAPNIKGLSEELFTSNPLDYARSLGWL